MIEQVKDKLIDRIGSDSYASWFRQDICSFSSPFYGVLVVEASSRWYKDEIIRRFGAMIHEIALSFGFKKACVLRTGEGIPQAEPPLTPEQQSQLKAVLSRIGQFGRSAGNGKAPKELFSYGTEVEIIETPKPKYEPNYVYTGTKGLIKHQPVQHYDIAV